MYRFTKSIKFRPINSYSIVSRTISHHMKRSVKDTIHLNSTESRIKSLLLEFCNHYNLSIHDPSQQLTLRITGGWVRDKLLGEESHDLDIAINVLTGEEFVGKLTEYLNQHHPDLPLGTVHTIKKNPEKSKHLETCTTNIYNLDIDFVNLRSEKYSSDSRIPIIECGTAEEDALRRDATLNALFYNLNEDKIEDFTNRGLDDLKNGILRTPLKPLQTFLDDPLRALRLVRFASRYNFIIEQETLDAMKEPEINSALLHKISRERVGVELDKCLSGPNPQYGLRLLNYVRITDSVFNVGTVFSHLKEFNDASVVDEYHALSEQLYPQISIASTLFTLFQQSLTPSLKELCTFSSKHFWLSVVLMPFKNLTLKVSNKKAGLGHVPEIIVKEGLRFGKSDFEPVSTVLSQLDNSKLILDKVAAGTVSRSELGLYLRQFGVHFNLNLIVNLFDEIISESKIEPSQGVPGPEPDHVDTTLFSSIISQKVAKYEAILATIKDQDLVSVHTLKPLIDGRTISKALDKKPGPWMSQVTQQVLVWQLDHPQGTTDECLEFLRHSLQ